MKDTLFPYREGNVEQGAPFLIGFIRRNGSIAIEPQFDGVSFFGLWETGHHLPIFPDVWKSLIMVTKNGKQGFINPAGELVIPIKFGNSGYFSEDFACVCLDPGGKWGFIDKQGEFLIAPIFDRYSYFKNGLACVRLGGRYGVIDKDAKWIIKPTFEELGDFHEGLAPARIDGKYGFIDLSGRIKIYPEFESAQEFSEGLAAVQVNDRYGYINRNGDFEVDPEFSIGERFSGGLAAVYHDNSSAYGFIDRTGKLVITPKFYSAGTFFNGIVLVQDIRSRLYAMINTKGENILNKEFVWLDPYFHEDLVFGVFERAEPGSRGFFDISGNLRIRVENGDPRPFYFGLAAIELDDGIGYIDKNGKFVFRPQLSRPLPTQSPEKKLRPTDSLLGAVREIENSLTHLPPDSFAVLNEDDAGRWAANSVDNRNAYGDSWSILRKNLGSPDQKRMLSKAYAEVRSWVSQISTDIQLPERGCIIEGAYRVKEERKRNCLSMIYITPQEAKFIHHFMASLMGILMESDTPPWSRTEAIRRDAVAILALLTGHEPLVAPKNSNNDIPAPTQGLTTNDRVSPQGPSTTNRDEKDEEKPQPPPAPK